MIASEMGIHEVCDVFPMMSPEEFAGLRADIAAHGQREPIRIYRGMLIDGRNRLRACEELGIEPKVEQWDGEGSLVAAVVSLNLHRRHLTTSQRIACGVDIEEALAREARERHRAGSSAGGKRSGEVRSGKVQSNCSGPSQQRTTRPQARDEAAAIVGVHPVSISRGKAVKKINPELHDEVKAGKKTIHQARCEIQRAEKRAVLESVPIVASPDWAVIEGDCLEVLETIEDRTVRLVFTDPPYNIGIDYGDHHDDSMPEAEYLDWCRGWMRAVARKLTRDGSFWLLVNHEWDWRLIAIAVDEVGFHLRQRITWYESFGVNCVRKFGRCSRALLWFVADPNRFVFNAGAVTRPSDRQAIYDDPRANPDGRVWGDVWGIDPPIPRLAGTHKERVPEFPTQLPLGLLRAVVGCGSDRGDLILDPFNGSGTTGVAAIDLSRRYVGIEKSPEFVRLARKRLSSATA